MKKLSFIIVFCLLLFASCNQQPANQNSDTPTESIGSVPSETTEPTMPETQPQTEPLTEPTVPDSDVVYDENGNFPAVVMYHLIMETPYNNNETLFVRPGDFEAQLQALTEAGYDFLFANDYNKTAGNSIILTFDDGYLDNYTTMFPLLKKYSAKATVFLISDMIGHPEYMNEAQIKEMADSGLVKFDKNSLPCNLVAPGVVGIIMPYSQYVNVVNKGEKASNISMSVCIETDDHKNVAKNLNNILTEKDYGGTFVSDNVDTLQTMNTVIFIVQVFVYGFISLISLITIANIINTISTNISLRRKEFAMLKSVGTAPSGFRKMVSLESVFYALKAVIFGVPISVLVCVLLNKMLGESSIPYQFDYKLYLGVILVVFAIIAVTMIYSVRKLKDDNIIETLKEDIS